jgi:hypothetical protein
MENANNLYNELLGAFASIGVPAIRKDTAARILAVVYVHGNNEALVYNHKFIAEIEHIKASYGIDGGETPDAEITELIQLYVKELEQYRDEHSSDTGEAVFASHAPEWARTLFMDRYGIKLIN